MASGGIAISGLEFMSYRVVEMEIKTLPVIAMLFTEITSNSDWELRIGFSDITFVPNNRIYVVPLEIIMNLIKVDSKEKRPSDSAYLSTRAVISGVFRFTDNCTMSKELREKMIRQQAPAIIMPYIRATISTMLISAGFGGITMPLINLYEMTAQTEPVKIISIENDSGKFEKSKTTSDYEK